VACEAGTGRGGQFALAGLTALTAALVWATPVFAREPSVVDVVDRYVNARNRGDVNAIVSLFADEATVTWSNGRSYAGQPEVRRLMQQGIFRGESILIANRRQVGDHVSWDEQVRYPGSTLGVKARAIIRDGRILSLAYGTASLLEGQSEAQSARTGFPALTGFGAVAIVLVGAFTLLLACTQPERGSASRPQRRNLMPSLKRWNETRRAVRA
jgi:hypothetical protein